MNTTTSDNTFEEAQIKKKWMKYKHSTFYDIAIQTSTQENKNIWFDPRYWKPEHIREFFEDLQFADNHIYEMIVKKLPKSRVSFNRQEAELLKYKNDLHC